MKVTLETITPQEAERLLQTNSGNRKVRKNRVALYAKQISNGQWQSTGEAIKFSKSGRLIDGQHRLHAVVVANIPAEFLVIRDLDDEVFKVLDSGMARSASDVVRALGLTSPGDSGAIARMYMVAVAGFNPNNTNMTSLVTKTDIANFVEDHRDSLVDATALARSTRNSIGGSITAWGVIRLMAEDSGCTAEFDQFVADVVSGAGLHDGDPRLALRNWLSRNSRPQQSGATSAIHLGTYLKAFAAHINGDTMMLLRSWDSRKPLPQIPAVTRQITIFP